MTGLPDSRYEGPDESPGFLLWRVASEWQRLQRKALDGIGITHPQFVLLAGIRSLESSESPVTQAVLARFVHMDEMVTSQVLRGLESRGLLIRSPHPDDNRSKCLNLAPAGAKLLRLAVPLVENVDGIFFSLSDKQLGEMSKIFQKLLAEHSRRHSVSPAYSATNGGKYGRNVRDPRPASMTATATTK